MIEVQDIKDSFERLKHDIADVDDVLFCEWAQFTTRFIYDKVKKIDAERFVKSKLYAVTADPETFALEVDFGNLNQTACGVYLYNVSDSLATNTKIGITGYGSTDTGYYVSGGNVIFTGCEDESYYMRYLPKPPTITALTHFITVDGTNTGAVIVEDEDLDYMVKAVDVLYEQWDDNPAKESLADFRFVRALGGVLDGYNRTPQISVMRNSITDY